MIAQELISTSLLAPIWRHGHCPPMVTWTREQRSRLAKRGWQTRRRQPTAETQAQARLAQYFRHGDSRILRLVACDLAEAVLPRYAEQYPGDPRPAACLWVARQYAMGKVSEYERLGAHRIAATICETLLDSRPTDPAFAPAQAIGFTLYRPAGEALRWTASWSGNLTHAHGASLEQAQTLIAAIEAKIAEVGGQS